MIAFLHLFWHPLGQCAGTHAEVLRCHSYNFWSGIGSDFGEVTLIGGLVMAYRHIECHQKGCHRLGRFTHGHLKLCHVHHPKVPSDGKITAEHIARVK